MVQLKTRSGKIDLHAVLKELGRREILSVLLEAGPSLNGAALAASAVHKLVLFYAPKLAGVANVPFAHLPKIALHELRLRSFQQFGPDLAVEAIFRKPAQ